MAKNNIISTGLGLLREGTLLVRRMQMIGKDLGLNGPNKKEKSLPFKEIGGYTDLERIAKELFKDPALFKELQEPSESSRFDWLLGIPGKIGCDQLWQLWKETFQCSSPFGDSIDKEIESGGSILHPYLFRLHKSVEPDEETLGLSGSEMIRKRMQAISLPEFMIAELFHFKLTRGGHLNLLKSTLCAGTKFKDGSIPEIRFENRCVVIDWAKANHAEPNMGTRLVIKR